MMSKLLAILAVLATANAAMAQTDEKVVPKTMLGFLTAGMHVDVQSFDGTPNVILNTYSADDYAIALELADQNGPSITPAETVAETNVAVRKELELFRKQTTSSDPSRDRIMIVSLPRKTYGTIVAVGEDFILLELEGPTKRRRIIPKTSIGTINLDVNPIRLINLESRSRNASDG